MDTHTTPSSPTTTTSFLRRVALLALGLLVVLTGVGLGASPASAAAPTAPRPIIAIGFDEAQDFVRVHWAPPAHDGFDPVHTYVVERSTVGQPAAPKQIWQLSTTAPLVDKGVTKGVQYSYRVKAANDDGISAWSTPMLATVQQFHTEHWAFGTGIDDFVVRQYQDILGRNPSSEELGMAIVKVGDGSWTTGKVIGDLLAKPERAHRGQIIRLYNAYFDRNADHAGLEYWGGQMKGLGKTINVVSNSFAASPEFKAEYGNLTNAQFVTLVYQNVLDRNPTADEAGFWKAGLDQGTLTRGKVMTYFSESAEYKFLSKGLVQAADVYDAMVGEASGGSELTLWSTHIQHGGNAGDYGTRIMLLNKY